MDKRIEITGTGKLLGTIFDTIAVAKILSCKPFSVVLNFDTLLDIQLFLGYTQKTVSGRFAIFDLPIEIEYGEFPKNSFLVKSNTPCRKYLVSESNLLNTTFQEYKRYLVLDDYDFGMDVIKKGFSNGTI